MSQALSLQLLYHHVPPAAVAYCQQLFVQHQFQLQVTRPRKTRLGAFIYKHGQATIQVNNNLNPYAFLITYLHEVAHLLTFAQHGRAVRPHGSQWQQAFSALLLPVANSMVFPPDVLAQVQQLMRKPGASTCADPALFETLRRFDKKQAELASLHSLQPGAVFLFKRQEYKLVEHRRTRSRIVHLASQKEYLLSAAAGVKPLPNHAAAGQQLVHLHTLAVGSQFLLQGKTFALLAKRRTRAQCQLLPSGPNYSVALAALVQPL